VITISPRTRRGKTQPMNGTDIGANVDAVNREIAGIR